MNRQASYHLRLAVDEFATNAITHGGAAAASGSIDVRAEMDDNVLTVIIEDRGAPFDPRQIGGLRIFPALQGIDRFSYE